MSVSHPSGVEARVFAMPERYRHGAQVSLHQPEKKEPPKSFVEVKTPGVPAAPKAPPKPATLKKKGSTVKKILAAGIAGLVLLSVGGFFLLRGVEEVPTQSVRPTMPTSRPAPTREPDTVSETVPTTEPEPEVFPVEIVPGMDSDSDGLTDAEETLVYRTDPRLPDTDADGFLDGNEVFHRYNPGGTAPGTLLESGLVVLANGTAQLVHYRFSYPSAWELEEGPDELTLDAGTGEGFRISFEPKSESQTLETWVRETLTLERPIAGTTKNGLALVQSRNQLEAYVDLGSAVIAVAYDTGVKARVEYLQTLQMMLNSVEVVREADETDEAGL